MMRIDFGKVNRYNADRGFGFVSHSFSKSPSNEVFFHIKSVKRTHPDLARALNTYNLDETLFFWYEFGASDKGQQVLAILNPLTIRQNHIEHASAFTEIIGINWANLETPVSKLIKKATFDLLLPDEAHQLSVKREFLEEEKKINYEIQKAESAKLQELANQNLVQEEAEQMEFRQLVAEISVLKFTKTIQINNYIFKHRLGGKYKHISGILEMRKGGYVWFFNDGIAPKFFRKLCDELGLEKEESATAPGRFESYNDIEKRKKRQKST